MRRIPAEVGVLLVLGALPLLSLVGHPGGLLADPGSEYPIKLWAFETFLRMGLFGADVDLTAFPHGGPLNNADVAGTLVAAVARPFVGRVAAYDIVVMVPLQATMIATWLLARDLVEDRRAALLAAVAFALTPLVLVYCVAGAVTDMLNLWPYPLAMRAFLRGGVRNGVWSGVWAGLGVMTCPYNVLVFAVASLPAGLFALGWGRVVGRGSLGGALLGCVLGLAPVGGAGVWELTRFTAAPDAQIGHDAIATTRNVAPYPFLDPGHRDRYTAYLADYVAVGKAALIEREAGSRYYRAFSPGLSLLALALVGLVARPRATALWATIAVWAAVVSIGPFFPVTGALHASTPVNVAWLAVDRWVPGADLLLEPFRYGLGAAFGLSLCAAHGLAWLSRRWGGWVAPVAVIGWLAELVFVSPVPVPLPVATPRIDAVYAQLGDLPQGALVELPFFDQGTDRFNRVHFLHQLVHGRPIPDELIGSAPRAYFENQFLATVVHAEKPLGRIRVDVSDPARVDADRERLGAEGYAAFLVDVDGFGHPRRRDEVLALLAPFGPPERFGNLLLFRVDRADDAAAPGG